MSGAPTAVRVGLLGCGVVGSQVARLLSQRSGELAARIGAPVELCGIAVRRLDRGRGSDLDPSLFTTDAAALVRRGDLDVVIETIGGVEPARGLILAALHSGASVVTANKALLATDGPTLLDAADAAERDLYFEAAVAGAIPIVRPLRDSLAGDQVTRVVGIVNGTTNFILDKMATDGADFSAALQQAQALGYAESDPTADVDGSDAAAKAALLAGLAFHTRMSMADVYQEGITGVSARDVAFAGQLGLVVKLLAICELHETPDGHAVSARVHPAMIPAGHPLASVRAAYNAVFVESRSAGELMFYGPGAGGAPTASAVLGDLVTVAQRRLDGVPGRGQSAHARYSIRPIGQTLTRLHIALDIADRAGVLTEVAGEFARHDVSIETVRQEGRGQNAQLLVVTHQATDAALRATVRALAGLDVVRHVVSVMRVEAEEG